MYNFIIKAISWEVQAVVAGVLFFSAMILMVSAPLRYISFLDGLAIGKDEPFWVLLLSEAALVYAAYGMIPAILALRKLELQESV